MQLLRDRHPNLGGRSNRRRKDRTYRLLRGGRVQLVVEFAERGEVVEMTLEELEQVGDERMVVVPLETVVWLDQCHRPETRTDRAPYVTMVVPEVVLHHRAKLGASRWLVVFLALNRIDGTAGVV